MTEQELDALVDAKLADALAARLEADRARVRDEVVTELRRAEERAWYDRINKKHPIENKYSGLTREQHEARIAAMRAGAARDAEHMARSNARVVEGSLEYRRRGEGFAIKPVGQR
jgi:hypothetical protein